MRSTRKASPGGNAGSAPRLHGSSLRELGAPLDQERAASMADEGGVSGAQTDALAQTRSHTRKEALTTHRFRSRLRRALPWVLVVTGVVGGLVAAAWAWQRSRDY